MQQHHISVMCYQTLVIPFTTIEIDSSQKFCSANCLILFHRLNCGKNHKSWPYFQTVGLYYVLTFWNAKGCS